jgi:hypothetical protein
VIEYAMASYYMTKSAHTYIAPYFNSQSDFEDRSGGGNWPDFTYEHGAALDAKPLIKGLIYRRTFDKLLALVNPSSTKSAVYDLGGVYHGFDGVRYTGTITLAPLTGLTLLPGEPTR